MIFFEDDNSFSLYAPPLGSVEELTGGLWLTLVGINETPPHIALISESKYYSLNTRKVDCGTPVERFANTLERKHIPALFIYIETKNDFILSLEKIYKNLQPLKNTENTCLSPIKDFFVEKFSAEFATANYVYELLATAQNKGLVKECSSLFCEDANSNTVTLPKYTMTQIKNKIQELSSQQIS